MMNNPYRNAFSNQMKVIVVSDIVADGTTARETANAVIDRGGNAIGAVILFQRHLKATEKISGLPLRIIFGEMAVS